MKNNKRPPFFASEYVTQQINEVMWSRSFTSRRDHKTNVNLSIMSCYSDFQLLGFNLHQEYHAVVNLDYTIIIISLFFYKIRIAIRSK